MKKAAWPHCPLFAHPLTLGPTAHTSKLRGRFLTTADAMHSQPSTDGAILIGRNEYTLVIQQAKTGVVAWNMTLAQ